MPILHHQSYQYDKRNSRKNQSALTALNEALTTLTHTILRPIGAETSFRFDHDVISAGLSLRVVFPGVLIVFYLFVVVGM